MDVMDDNDDEDLGTETAIYIEQTRLQIFHNSSAYAITDNPSWKAIIIVELILKDTLNAANLFIFQKLKMNIMNSRLYFNML